MPAFGITLDGTAFNTAYTAGPSTPEMPAPPMLPGTLSLGTEGTEWLFAKVAPNQTIAAGDFVYVSSTDNSFVVSSLANAAKALKGMLVGVAGAAVTTGAVSFSYIWVCRRGFFAGANVQTGATANTDLHTTATAGRLHSSGTASTTGTVAGVVALAAAASNQANVMLNSPVIAAAD